MKTLPELTNMPLISNIAKLSLNPSDTLIVKVNTLLTTASRKATEDYFKAVIGIDTKVIVIDSNMSLTIITTGTKHD